MWKRSSSEEAAFAYYPEYGAVWKELIPQLSPWSVLPSADVSTTQSDSWVTFQRTGRFLLRLHILIPLFFNDYCTAPFYLHQIHHTAATSMTEHNIHQYTKVFKFISITFGTQYIQYIQKKTKTKNI